MNGRHTPNHCHQYDPVCSDDNCISPAPLKLLHLSLQINQIKITHMYYANSIQKYSTCHWGRGEREGVLHDFKGSVGVRIILKWILKGTGQEGMDGIHPVQDRDKWQALMNMVMYPKVP